MAESAQTDQAGPGTASPLKPYSLFSAPQEVVTVMFGGQKFHVYNSVLSKYAEGFHRCSEEQKADNENEFRVFLLQGEGVESEAFASYLDLIYRHHFSGCHDPIYSVNDGDTSLELLSTLAKVHQLCNRLRSPIISAWVTKEFIRLINVVTPRWNTIAEQEESLKWLERAFLDWQDANCKQMVVAKFNKTLPDDIYTKLVPSLHHDFLAQVAIYRPKMIIEQYESKHNQPSKQATKKTSIFGAAPLLGTGSSSGLFAIPQYEFKHNQETQQTSKLDTEPMVRTASSPGLFARPRSPFNAPRPT